MKFGDIFKAIVGEDYSQMDLQTIERKACKKVSFKRYGKNLVSGRGSIFKNRFFDIDKTFEKNWPTTFNSSP